MQTLLRMPAVMAATALARPTLYRDMKDGMFPRPIKIGRVSAWLANEPAAINAARARGASAAEIKALVVDLEAQRHAPSP